MTKRITIDQIDQSRPPSEWKRLIADRGRRRHLSYTIDFDTRAMTLTEPGETWAEEPKRLHLENRERTKAALAQEFGNDSLDEKIVNFADIGTKPFSILAYHNAFFDQVRRSFVIGAYYPALIGACALGERILNHLILDLREYYKHTKEYKFVSRKNSFDNWTTTIEVLESWNVLLPTAAQEFRSLMKLRHRSIHFDVSTYKTLRADALAALLHMREIIDQQFCAFGLRPWFISGTRGFIFIKRDWEDNPFIQTYYVPVCPFVGPHFSISFTGGLSYYDHRDYGDGSWTDDEYARVFEERTYEQLANTT